MTSAPTVFLMHPAGSLHDTGWGHPEHQGRLRALAAAVAADMPELHGRVEAVEPEEVDEEVVLRVHTADHVDLVRRAVEQSVKAGQLVGLDGDTRVSPASWDATMGSVGAAVTAARGVVEGRWANGFVASRPPGHHATPDRAMGFCLFNMVAATARWLQAEGHAERVLILDWDVHHGNGTQDIFWEDGSVYYLSLHQFPHYPGTGRASDRGAGAGAGKTLNIPIPPRTSRADYLQQYHRALDQAFAEGRPDFVLVSAGFDCLANDPLGDLLLEPEDLHGMAKTLLERAEAACRGRVVACLEGGYHPPRTAEASVAVIRALAGLELGSETSSEAANR